MADLDMPPTISVVIPARDEAEYICIPLASVAAQHLAAEEVEVVVVANGCSDGTADVARILARSLPAPRVRVLELPTPSVSAAKNAGARAASGRLLLFLDADSRVAPDLLVRICERAGAGERAASIRMIADTTDGLDRAFFRLIELKSLFAIRANMFYCERELFLREGGFDESLRQAEDRDFIVRLQRGRVSVGHIRESWIATSARRLHALPFRLSVPLTLARWGMGHAGIGRRWRY